MLLSSVSLNATVSRDRRLCLGYSSLQLISAVLTFVHCLPSYHTLTALRTVISSLAEGQAHMGVNSTGVPTAQVQTLTKFGGEGTC